MSVSERTRHVTSTALPRLPATARPAVAPAPLVRERGGSRRLVNVIVALVGIAVAAPLMAVIAVLVKLTSRGPLLYTQTRVGVDRRNPFHPAGNGRRGTNSGGRPFRIYKFRTMYHRAGNRQAEVWARPDDPRVTPIGRFLRQYRLDELPQLFNVLRGDMNIVGPRPEQPTIFQDLRRQIDGYELRQRVRPGITGWAQINQHYDRSIEDVKKKIAFDLEYVKRHSLFEDVKIMMRTLPVILFKRGAW